MVVNIGALVFVTVDYVRTARYRRRNQTESHRTPRYRVRYQMEGQPIHEAVVGPNPRPYLVADIRESRPGDIVEVTLSEDGENIVAWANRTHDEFWSTFNGPWEECD
ncbi:conserved protein of unknown function [Burkholderia multivorans]